ncbi:MAG: family 43 glycosylhydrolase [Verrucomicrobiales bacterium]
MRAIFLWVFGMVFWGVAAGNPLFVGADPHALFAGGKLWIYPTGGGGPKEMFAYASADFKTWEKHGPVFSLEGLDWVTEDGAPRHLAWAPGVVERDGTFYLYYSVGPQNPTPSRIGVAVAKSPDGAFVDSGKALLTGGRGFEAIDPMVFRDPKSGKYFLYAGGSAGATLRVFELAEDMVSFAREVPTETPEKFTEGAFMHFYDGRYYLSYSHGSFRDASYSVHYSTAESPVGPWRYEGAILVSDRQHKGPGHHSFVQVPGSEDWLVVYHRWNGREGRGPYRGKREIAIELMEHAEDGKIRPIQMTDEGVRRR